MQSKDTFDDATPVLKDADLGSEPRERGERKSDGEGRADAPHATTDKRRCGRPLSKTGCVQMYCQKMRVSGQETCEMHAPHGRTRFNCCGTVVEGTHVEMHDAALTHRCPTEATDDLITRLGSVRFTLQECMEAEDDTLAKSDFARAQAWVKEAAVEIESLIEVREELSRSIERQNKEADEVRAEIERLRAIEDRVKQGMTQGWTADDGAKLRVTPTAQAMLRYILTGAR